MDALFAFAVGFTWARPIRPDQATTYISLLGEDSSRGLAEARQTAITWAMFANNSPMVTSVELLAVEL